MTITDSFYDVSLSQLIDDHDIVHIYRHTNPDPDAIGAAAGLAELIDTNFSRTLVRLAGDDTPDMKALPEPRFDAPQEDDYNVRVLAIVVDTANETRIDGSGYTRATTVVKLDHHPVNQLDEEYTYADFEHVNTGVSSSAELVTSLATRFGWDINCHAAEFLYIGLLGDTGAFSYNVRPSTFTAAATLAATGIDVVAIKQATATRTRGQVAAYGYIAQDMARFDESAGYHLTAVNDVIMERGGFNAADAHAAVNAARVMDGLLAWAVAIEQTDAEDGRPYFRVSLRSNGPEINSVASHFGGGGHPRAAGCTVEVGELNTVREMLAEAVASYRAEQEA
ncbi:MAG: hypothetical protein DI609_00430 [Corynebacterium urealyticum]|uniref:Uncharacterized protein n=1 Tax=Corynebacterium urealyticum TaxID=43771 RepID=A0A2W5BAI2_9CORY|nr:MAG: hypothetical protein DI609_00430 [Corynebacterium urealyticum]